MNKPLWGAASAMLALAACRAEPEAQAPIAAPNESAPVPEAETESLPDADINASLGQLGESPPPPPALADQTYRFVGSWATEESGCANRAWRFTRTGLQTPAGSVCRFEEISAVPGGYDIRAACTAESPERADTISLRFPASAGGMLFESESIADAGLTSCRQ